MKTIQIHMPKDWTLSSIHSDLLALATISIIYPFCGPEIHLPIGVSKYFEKQFNQFTGKNIPPVNNSLSPRKAKENAVSALTYSGGDSTAAMLLLPPDTHLFYFDRIHPNNRNKRKSKLNKEPAYYASDFFGKAR
ncbi:hypothetical protein BKP37_17815 [Anaerobacillus alkalilacustris]|uniref:Uncharacterized protein n=2 Tax=Anaerobacillus alkalilacustris TaxID=393763 RepID=A0A1S2LD26_9BACI|nr:hypothetical protein BKP37_17815 [Anaerobacillus alkalilacustris]